ncbi:MAG: AMP-binding protein [Chloroflexi bacterium]|nr:AMP-binding protein [Chloroflexota bacterium]
MNSISRNELIRRTAAQYGAKPAVVTEGRSLTFSEVNYRANRLANALKDLGLKPRDRVATLMHNCLEYPEIEFALAKGSFPQVTLNPRLIATDQLFQIDETESVALIVQHEYMDLVKPIRADLEKVKHIICFDGNEAGMLEYDKLLSSASVAEPEGELEPDDLGEIRYTSGTTGKPKGVMLQYWSRIAITRNFLCQHLADLTNEDRFLALQPLYHGAGWFIFPVWLRGATQFIVPSFEPEIAFRVIEKEKITCIKTVPTVLIRLLDSPEIKSRNLKSIRTIMYGGSPMPAERLKEAQQLFGPILANVYGQLEAAMTISFLPKRENIGSRIGSVGRPCIFVSVKLVDEKDKEVAPGVVGELIIKGDHQMTGYLNRPEATAETLRDGWIHTNDLGMSDKEGYIYLTGGRKTQMIKSGGLVVYPAEVEQVLYKMPAVREVAVIGVPDPVWIEAVKACVVLKDGYKATEKELIAFCKEHLPGYKAPKSVDFVKELPHNAAGKVMYAELRKQYAEAKR